MGALNHSVGERRDELHSGNDHIAQSAVVRDEQIRTYLRCTGELDGVGRFHTAVPSYRRETPRCRSVERDHDSGAGQSELVIRGELFPILVERLHEDFSQGQS